MPDFDARLRALASESIDRAAAETLVDDDLAAVRARTGGRPTSGRDRERDWPWIRLAVAATIVLLVAGAVTILATRDDSEELVAPPATAGPATNPTPTATPTMAATTSLPPTSLPPTSLPAAAVATTTAPVVVVPEPTTTLASDEPPLADQLPADFYARFVADDAPYFGIGSPEGELSDDEIGALLRREVSVGRGSTVRLLAPQEPYGRCDNREVSTSGPTAETTPDPDLMGPVRSLAATADGIVIVGVDVCPDGAQWGDPETRFELRRIDLGTGSTTVLHVREPGDGDTFFADRNVVYAGGDFVVESVSPDGEHVAVAEPYSPETTRYHVIDAVTGGEPIRFRSACDDPRDLVGPPRFVGDGLVVLARECSPVDVETGDLIVELVSLETREPVWSVDVDHVSIDSHTRTVSLSADSFDGEVWALVSGSAGVEQPVRAAAVAARGELPLPVDTLVAFTPEELIEPWDPYPS